MQVGLSRYHATKFAPITERSQIAEAVLHATGDYYAGELERQREEIAHLRTVLKSVLVTMPEKGFVRVLKDQGFQIQGEAE